MSWDCLVQASPSYKTYYTKAVDNGQFVLTKVGACPVLGVIPVLVSVSDMSCVLTPVDCVCRSRRQTCSRTPTAVSHPIRTPLWRRLSRTTRRL